MEKSNKTKFNAIFNPMKVANMRKAAEKIAVEEGLTNADEIDAFRHAYVSAKMQEHIRKVSSHDWIPETISDSVAKTGAYAAGSAVEWAREAQERKNSWGIKGNPKDEWAQDMDNNSDGQEIEETLHDFGMSAEDKERSLRESIAKAAKSGSLQTTPSDKNQRYYPDGKPITDGVSNTIPKKQSSILDGIGSAVGKVGDAVAEASQMAFDAVSSVGTDTLVHMVTAGGDTTEATKIAMAQALGRMHSLVMREVDMQTQQSGIMSERIMIPEPDAKTKEAIEGTLNNPANAEIFDKVGSKIEAILQDTNDVDPARLLVSKVMEVLRGGGIQIEPSILIPDLFPQEDGEARKPQKGENVIEIAGIAIPIKIPEIRMPKQAGVPEGAMSIIEGEFDAAGGGISAPKTTGLHRGVDGAIEVKGYVRGDGTQVRSHSRTAPDDILANNFSFRK